MSGDAVLKTVLVGGIMNRLLANKYFRWLFRRETASYAQFTTSRGLSDEKRCLVSDLFIEGNGIEIGALHNPLTVNKSKAKVRYVDRFDSKELKRHYPECQGIVEVNVIDNGEKLSTFADASLDFIIANHMLEHCKNPIATIEVFLNILKSGGCIYLAIPNKLYTFDKTRELTPFEHLLDDYRNGDSADHYPHYVDFARHCDKIEDDSELSKRVDLLLSMDYSIHYHVWDNDSFLVFLQKINEIFSGRFVIELYLLNNMEIISILRKK